MPDQFSPTHSEQFLSYLIQKYPGLMEANQLASQEPISPNLISPFVVELPRSVLEQAREIISTLFALAHQENYRDYYQPQTQALGLQNPGNYGIMMSYDFHIDGSGNLKLIEVNTNAAFLILGYELYQMRALAPSCSNFTLDTLKECIINELSLSQTNEKYQKHDSIKAAIIDDKPDQQRLYFEFLVARELFKKFGFESEILDSQDLKIGDFGFVYNRDTDFYLSSERTRNLKTLYDSGKICLSPNPFEYFLLADKQRMIEWGQSEWQIFLGLNQKQLEIIHKHVPLCLDLAKISPEEVWNLRKKLFFKPKRAFGSKQTYRGSSMSRKVFENFLPEEFLAQEYVPAAEISCATPEGSQNFKYDLRCYAYMGELQLVMARLYQGQVTNSKTPYGGFACVQFS
ncbi:MAG: hypothetical protein JNM39_09940 [Bdellovibrionaceae bacterium]|nr:hypothetical protein [Pseudobdellovibrionaceae bacterium]